VGFSVGLKCVFLSKDPKNGHFRAFCVLRHEKLPRTLKSGKFGIFLSSNYNGLQTHFF